MKDMKQHESELPAAPNGDEIMLSNKVKKIKRQASDAMQMVHEAVFSPESRVTSMNPLGRVFVFLLAAMVFVGAIGVIAAVSCLRIEGSEEPE